MTDGCWSLLSAFAWCGRLLTGRGIASAGIEDLIECSAQGWNVPIRSLCLPVHGLAVGTLLADLRARSRPARGTGARLPILNCRAPSARKECMMSCARSSSATWKTASARDQLDLRPFHRQTTTPRRRRVFINRPLVPLLDEATCAVDAARTVRGQCWRLTDRDFLYPKCNPGRGSSSVQAIPVLTLGKLYLRCVRSIWSG
jgi:hypothetical protein